METLEYTWPNFFIVGAQKAGTSSLNSLLGGIPEIYMSPLKEPNYFSPNSPNRAREKKRYLGFFRGVTDEIAIGEASPSYLWDPDSPKLIHDAIPEARIIISLRDPVQRAYSQYLMRTRPQKSTGIAKETRTFMEAIRADYDQFLSNVKREGMSGRYIELGLYSGQVKRYFDRFEPEKVRVLIFEELIQDIKATVIDLIDFLGVSRPANLSLGSVQNTFGAHHARPTNAITGKILRSSTIRRAARFIVPEPIRRTIREMFLIREPPKPSIPEEGKKFLHEIYKEDVQKLSRLLGRSLPWPVANE